MTASTSKCVAITAESRKFFLAEVESHSDPDASHLAILVTALCSALQLLFTSLNRQRMICLWESSCAAAKLLCMTIQHQTVLQTKTLRRPSPEKQQWPVDTAPLRRRWKGSAEACYLKPWRVAPLSGSCCSAAQLECKQWCSPWSRSVNTGRVR